MTYYCENCKAKITKQEWKDNDGICTDVIECLNRFQLNNPEK